jgi:hypothetical protein
MHIVNEVIKSSQDEVAKQYREHTPLFINGGSALPVATADIKHVGSVVDDAELDSNHWHLSVMHLSDHHKKEPQAVFLLLEQRNYAGDHIIKKIALQKGTVTVETKAINPNNLNTNLREAIFGKMIYQDTKPRYYGSSFALSEEVAQKLLLTCASQAISGQKGDAYRVLHELAARYVALLQNSNNQSSLLSLSWPEYVKQPEVVEYKKDKLLQVDAEQVRRDSDAIESKEERKNHGKQLQDQKWELHKNLMELQDHEERIDKVEVGMKDQKEQLQEYGIETEDHKQRIEISEMKIKKQEEQLQENGIEIEDHKQQIEIIDMKMKDQKEQLEEYGMEVQDHVERIEILEISGNK